MSKDVARLKAPEYTSKNGTKLRLPNYNGEVRTALGLKYSSCLSMVYSLGTALKTVVDTPLAWEGAHDFARGSCLSPSNFWVS